MFITTITGFGSLIRMSEIYNRAKTELYCSVGVALINKQERQGSPKLYIQSEFCNFMFRLKTFYVDKYYSAKPWFGETLRALLVSLNYTKQLCAKIHQVLYHCAVLVLISGQ